MNRVSFLQSSEWQAIQEKIGRPTWRIGSALVIRHDLPLGLHYLYCPRPEAATQGFFEGASDLADRDDAMFLKIDPATELKIQAGGQVGSWRQNSGRRLGSSVAAEFKIVNSHWLQPSSVVFIDCLKTNEELLAAMHPKTRYNIRLSERRGVEVRSIPATDIPVIWDSWLKIIQETARRERFTPHPQAHYRALAEFGSENLKNEFWFAEWKGRLVAAVMVNLFLPSGTMTYLHGGSSRTHSELMAPHLLHWRVIQAARDRGYRRYDFGGIDEKRWPGLTRFKRGFGGEVFNYPSSLDIIFRPNLYRLYRLQHMLRRG